MPCKQDSIWMMLCYFGEKQQWSLGLNVLYLQRQQPVILDDAAPEIKRISPNLGPALQQSQLPNKHRLLFPPVRLDFFCRLLVAFIPVRLSICHLHIFIGRSLFYYYSASENSRGFIYTQVPTTAVVLHLKTIVIHIDCRLKLSPRIAICDNHTPYRS